MGAEGIPIILAMSNYHRLNGIILDIEHERDNLKKEFLIRLAFKYYKPTLFLMPLEYKNWKKIKEYYYSLEEVS